MKRIWICFLAGLLAGLGTAVTSAGPAAGEKALTADEMAGTQGACCCIEVLEEEECATTQTSACLSCIEGPGACGTAKEYSGNVFSICSGNGSGNCITVSHVDCSRRINCTQSEPWFHMCPTAGSACDVSLTTSCLTCTPDMPGPWSKVDNQLCSL